MQLRTSEPILPPQVYVELSANDPDATLYRVNVGEQGLDGNFNGRLAMNYRLEKVCVVPCGVSVDPGEFLVGGPGMRQSARFDLTGSNPHVGVDADMGSAAGLIGGWVMASVGAPVAALGLIFLILGLTEQPEEDTEDAIAPTTEEDLQAMRIGGGLAFVGGLGLVVTGLWLASDSKTTFELKPIE